MDRAWQRYLDMASGITQVTRIRAEQVVRTLVKRGEIAAERTEKAVDELLRRSEQNRRALAGLARSETERAVARLGLARQADLDRLERKVGRLEEQASAPARTVTGKKGTGKKATRKATGKKATRKATGKKATAKAAKSSKKSAGRAPAKAAKKAAKKASPSGGAPS